MSDSKFDIYEGNYLIGFGRPTVIVSANQVGNTTLYSEYFVFIEGENNLFWGGQISIETNGTSEHLMKPEDEALLQAEASISLEQAKLFEKKNIELWVRDQVILNKKENIIIGRLWMSGKFTDQLRRVKEKSKCEPLKAYISLLDNTKFYQYSEFE
ncbi:hypothetical protein EST62_01830 [Chlorobaculum sp. 24CR]|uniref:hypothetical protein n=1 Tax=Chlorobaculum sp. 24CR TaxID=2508878 RepID=UPI0010256884|nr:hypothetical protein [Chlorobaculum sp. 24CR]RXK88629.1 hypothetical protein EST62_01830 [Chlorobaculum sp. 24CR]